MKLTIEIDAKFGSEFQRQVATDMMGAYLRAWRDHLRGSHKKNDIDVKVNGDDIGDLDWINWE